MESLPPARFRCDAGFERKFRRQGYRFIAGADEAGRGCLFGPVFAAAVILPPGVRINGVRDSKELTPARREELAPRIAKVAVAWAIACATAEEIDRINIYQASRLAVKRAVSRISPAPDFLLVDALSIDLPLPQLSLVHGDARCRSIAAASILAKVHRDACMREWDALFPDYGLARSKGYGTPGHLAALQRLGPTPQHRFTFGPVRQFLPSRQMHLLEAASCG